MSPKGWFKTIVNLKKAKENRSKHVKDSTAEKSNCCSSSSKIKSHQAHDDQDSSAISNECLSIGHNIPAKPIEEIAATRIQNAFRRFKARKALKYLRGTVKFQALIQDHIAREQAATALSYIHTWSRIKDQVKARRLHMLTEAKIKQRKLENQLKLDAKLHELEVEWCCSSETMEEILSKIHQREEAAVKRERAMAYAFSHQWRPNSSQYFGQASYSLGRENWGWSWMERWVAARPWEIRIQLHPTTTQKLQNHKGHLEIAAALGLSNAKGKENAPTQLSNINKLPL